MAHVVTGKVRLSYVHLTQPSENLSGKLKYSCVILIPKSDTQTVERINAGVAQAKEEGRVKKWQGKIPMSVQSPLRDGDGQKPRGGAYGEECKGHWVLNATANEDRKPNIVDLNLQPILNASEIYSGMYARVGIDIYPFAAPGNSGISVAITNVQKVADGDVLGGSAPSAESDFGGSNVIDPFGGF